MLKRTVLGRPKTMRFESYVATLSDMAFIKRRVLSQLTTVNKTLTVKILLQF
jgi:hypothetical protein